jgi:hypothetical protein
LQFGHTIEQLSGNITRQLFLILLGRFDFISKINIIIADLLWISKFGKCKATQG